MKKLTSLSGNVPTTVAAASFDVGSLSRRSLRGTGRAASDAGVVEEEAQRDGPATAVPASRSRIDVVLLGLPPASPQSLLRIVTVITREEMYELVWNVPTTTAAARFGVSDVYLARVCAALDVPRPTRGWWRKTLNGTDPPPPPLPPAGPLTLDCWDPGKPQPVKRLARLARVRAGAAKAGTHPLVFVARNIFGAAGTSDDKTHLAPRRSETIDLTVSREALTNGLSLADALFKLMDARGHLVKVAPGQGFIRPPLENWTGALARTARAPYRLWTPVAPTIASVSGIPIGLAIMEITEEVLMRYVGDGNFKRASSSKRVYGITWTEWQRRPTRRLKVVAYSPYFPAPWQREWAETRQNSLVRMVAPIVDELERTALALPHATFFAQAPVPHRS